VVGKLDTETGTITEITSPKLAAVWGKLQKDGFGVFRGVAALEGVVADRIDQVWPGPGNGWLLAAELGNHGFRWRGPLSLRNPT
jgi:hypothetical protein